MAQKKAARKKQGTGSTSGQRANTRAEKVHNSNVQYVRRVAEVHGTAYTEAMSDAYWRGKQDGENTAARMVRRADPKNVRVRSLAVISDEPQEQGVALPEENAGISAPAAPAAQAVAVMQEPPAQVALPEEKPAETAPAIPTAQTIIETTEERRGEPTELIGVRERQNSREGEYIMNNDNNRTGGRFVGDHSGNIDAPVTYYWSVQDTPQEPVQTEQPVAQDNRVRTVGDVLRWQQEAKSKKPAKKAKPGKKCDEKEPKVRRIGPLVLQQWKEISFFRRIIMILSALLFLYGILPLFLGIFNVGIIPIALIAWFFFTAALLWNHIEGCKNGFINLLLGIVAVAVVLGITGMAFISGKMIGASLKTVPEDKTDVTVVVLGCLIRGDQPSLMLRDRLDTAAEYLLSNPEALCVVTGGQGDNEDYAEAYIMKKYLVAAGVSEGRIIMEDKSTSTVENIEFAAELIEKYNCHEQIAIVSDRFHQYRASLAAKDAGLVSYAMPCDTAWYLVMHYWFREMAGIVQIWLTA